MVRRAGRRFTRMPATRAQSGRRSSAPVRGRPVRIAHAGPAGRGGAPDPRAATEQCGAVYRSEALCGSRTRGNNRGGGVCNAKRLGGCLSGSFDRLTATRAPRRGGRNLGCIRLRFQNAFQPFIGPGAAAAGAGLQNAKRAARGGSRSRTPGPVSRSRAHSPASRARPAGRAGCRSGRPPWVLVSPAGLLKVKCRFVGCGYSQVEGIEGLR